MAPTCALSARPDPVTAALTSLGVCSATGMPARVAATSASPATCAVPITVRTLCWLNTRSTATTSGAKRAIAAVTASNWASSLAPISPPASVRTTSTCTAASAAPGSPVDHADAAAGHAGVDTEHAHASTPLPTPPDCRTVVRASLGALRVLARADTPLPRTVVAMVYDLGKARRRRRAVRPSPLFLAFVALAALGGVLAWADDRARARASAISACFVFVLGRLDRVAVPARVRARLCRLPRR